MRTYERKFDREQEGGEGGENDIENRRHRGNKTEEYEINNNKFSENETSQTDCYDEDDIEKANALQGKKECIIDILLGLKDRIESKELFTVKDICDRANTLLGVQVVRNRDIKNCLSKIYDDQIKFCIPDNCKQPTIFFYDSVTREYLAQICIAQNNHKEYG